jgi:hypothetical protein
LALITLCLAPRLAAGSDQTYVISSPLKMCGTVGPRLKDADAGAIILAALGHAPDDDTAYLLHVVTYNADMSVQEQHWYVYDPGLRSDFSGTRLFGRKHIALIYVHRGVPAVTMAAAEAQVSARAEVAGATLTAGQIVSLIERKIVGNDPNAGGDKEAARYSVTNAATGHRLVGVGALAVDNAFAPLANLVYQVDITKKTPAPLEHLEGLAKVIAAQGDALAIGLNLQNVDLCGGGAFDDTVLPADIKIAASVSVSDKTKSIGAATFDNEQRYWYDFSFALPLTSYNDLTVDTTDLTLTAKSVKKDNLFAVVDIGARRDTTRAGFAWPTVIYGMPLSGRAIHHQLVAASFGFSHAQVFVGAIFNHNQVVASAATTPNANTSVVTTTSQAVRVQWKPQLVYGLNVPVETILRVLKIK